MKYYLYIGDLPQNATVKFNNKDITSDVKSVRSGEKKYDGYEAPLMNAFSRVKHTYTVSIPKDKLDKVTVKFKYQIKVENQGQLEGYAKEVKDHIPAGLKFVAEDNKEYGWVLNEEDGTITTDYLKDTLLQPGETAEVTVVLTWINGADNLAKILSEKFSNRLFDTVDKVYRNIISKEVMESINTTLPLTVFQANKAPKKCKVCKCSNAQIQDRFSL